MSHHKEPQGFVTFAQNTSTVDYLKLAYVQAMNIKLTQKINKYAVIVDKQTAQLVTDKHRQVFDYVIELTEDYSSADARFANEWQVFQLTPFKETVKLESDLLFTRSIDHWWDTFRLRDVVLSSGCKNYLGEQSSSRLYRQFFDDNELPDVYNGLMYLRYSQHAAAFFTKARIVFENWQVLKDQALKNCREETPSTDVLYAITSMLTNQEYSTLPGADFINFTHMKSGLNGWSDNSPWFESVIAEQDADMIRINNLNQYAPVHYFAKDYVTDEMVKEYESRSGIN